MKTDTKIPKTAHSGKRRRTKRRGASSKSKKRLEVVQNPMPDEQAEIVPLESGGDHQVEPAIPGVQSPPVQSTLMQDSNNVQVQNDQPE